MHTAVEQDEDGEEGEDEDGVDSEDGEENEELTQCASRRMRLGTIILQMMQKCMGE